MRCFFERFGEYAIKDMLTAKDNNVKIAGIYCIFAPVELIYAAGAVPVGLCGKKQESIDAAEKILPTTLCPLIKSSFGYAVSNTCPFFEASDFIVGETTCDGKKKMFELMAQIKPLHLMHLPYSSYHPDALDYWHTQLLRLKDFLEQQTGNTIHPDELTRQISWQNQIRLRFQRLMELNRPETGHSPLKGKDLLWQLRNDTLKRPVPA
jgi:benzoyl-CoA reductase/2-hydroxyglutaryl-CoA dehydratase subunit BcrC/BadD/HgdB